MVVFVGAEAGTGCSSSCAGTGEALAAQLGAPVCLVDANLRYPALHQSFSVDSHFGLSDALLSSEPIRPLVRKIDNDNLWLLSSGSKAARVAGSLTTNRLKSRFEELRDQFAYILIDSPAINLHADGHPLGPVSGWSHINVGMQLDAQGRSPKRQPHPAISSNSCSWCNLEQTDVSYSPVHLWLALDSSLSQLARRTSV